MPADPYQRVSRADVFSPEYEEEIPNGHLVAQLEALIHNSLGKFILPESRKRRKFERSQVQESIPFRLVSTALPPKSISLEPKPPSTLIFVTREPAHEDDAVAAERRMRQAQDVAVDYAWIIEESKKPSVPPPHVHNKLVHVRAPSLDFASTPALAVIRTREDQPGRATCPPSELLHPPYSLKGNIHGHCFTHLDVNTITADCSVKHGKRKRRRGTAKEKIQPVFWRPNPAWGGKSAGYAVGYPSNWAAYEDDAGKYRRDSMRKVTACTTINPSGVR